jgi:dethiobiotin synthase
MTGGLRGAFVTGTDTGVGKSWVAAWLTRSWEADYWKPVQSGTVDGWDADIVRQVAPDAVIHPSRHGLSAPLSPHVAAQLAGVTIRLEDFSLPATDRPLVVEGAGGVLVPLNERDLMADLMARAGLPVVVTARSGLGTINHSLLTLEALRARGVEAAGVILVGPANPANRAAIERFGRVAVVAELPPLDDLAALRRHPPLVWRPWRTVP